MSRCYSDFISWSGDGECPCFRLPVDAIFEDGCGIYVPDAVPGDGLVKVELDGRIVDTSFVLAFVRLGAFETIAVGLDKFGRGREVRYEEIYVADAFGQNGKRFNHGERNVGCVKVGLECGEFFERRFAFGNLFRPIRYEYVTVGENRVEFIFENEPDRKIVRWRHVRSETRMGKPGDSELTVADHTYLPSKSRREQQITSFDWKYILTGLIKVLPSGWDIRTQK